MMQTPIRPSDGRPIAGYWKKRAYRRGPWQAVHTFYAAPPDDLDCDVAQWTFQATLQGRPWDGYATDWCFLWPISEEEYVEILWRNEDGASDN